MPHLKCIMFLSPDPETLEWVKEEIARPKYGGYWLCELFTFLPLSFPPALSRTSLLILFSPSLID